MNPMIEAGRSAEDEARWHLDRCFGKSKNWRVFHDLTLQDHRSNSPCQIDHVVIGRLGDIIVMETKSAVNGMRLDTETGAWTVIHNGREKPMTSPVEQNKRHIDVLAHHLKKNSVFPKRLGLPLRPTFHSWILVQPGVSLPLVFEKAWIVQRDQIEKRFDQMTNHVSAKDVLDILSVMGVDELDVVARFLDGCRSIKGQLAHDSIPAIPTAAATMQTPERPQARVCDACGVGIESNVAAFCRYNAKRFGGKYLCRKCQTFAPK